MTLTIYHTSPADDSDKQIYWPGIRPQDDPSVQEAILLHPGYLWPGDEDEEEDPASVEYEMLSKSRRYRYSDTSCSLERRCSGCSLWLPSSEVNFSGASSVCRWCARERSTAWRRTNNDKTRAQSERHYARVKAGGPDLSQEEREALLQAAGNRCACCGWHQDELDRPLELDHVKPLSLGGSNAAANRQVLCHRHNQQKGTREIDYRSSRRAA